MSGTCSTCKHARTAAEAGSTDLAQRATGALICHRYPPHAQLVPTPQGPGVLCIRPNVQPGDTCGEHALEIVRQ